MGAPAAIGFLVPEGQNRADAVPSHLEPASGLGLKYTAMPEGDLQVWDVDNRATSLLSIRSRNLGRWLMLRQVPRTILAIFKPGDDVPRSGVYRVIHANQHAKPHEVTCVYSDRFPPCRDCRQDVRFVLVRPAQHVASHEHFK